MRHADNIKHNTTKWIRVRDFALISSIARQVSAENVQPADSFVYIYVGESSVAYERVVGSSNNLNHANYCTVSDRDPTETDELRFGTSVNTYL